MTKKGEAKKTTNLIVIHRGWEKVGVGEPINLIFFQVPKSHSIYFNFFLILYKQFRTFNSTINETSYNRIKSFGIANIIT